jgi:hypothetical protein
MDCLKSLKLVFNLLTRFHDERIRYCHWKSNAFLEDSILGNEDLDVLVHRADYARCLEILASFRFKRANSIASTVHPGTEHYYGFDSETGKLVHFHLYYRIISGDSLVKNFHLPIETMLLDSPRKVHGVMVPRAEAELITLIIRCALKQGRVIERTLFDRDRIRIRRELDWLSMDLSDERVSKLLNEYFPNLTNQDLRNGEAVIKGEVSFLHRILTCWQFSYALESYKRYSNLTALLHSYCLTYRLISNRLLKRKGAMTFATGGVVVALVGPQATGKSTISKNLLRWLGCEFPVRVTHAGKPPSSLFTSIPNLVMPLARIILPRHRSSHIETSDDRKANYSLIHLLRVVCLAYDRKIMLLRMHKLASRGRIVVTDRYPSKVEGAIDSPHFNQNEIKMQSSCTKRFLMRLEARIYENIPSPDLVIRLNVPVDVAVQRDLKRDKPGKKDSNYIRRRHSMTIKPEFECTVEDVSTLDDYSKTEVTIRSLVWSAI